ncbi:DotU family type IV/VI secretion system protein [Achromobacter sp. MFA1 R4]|uniref:DotU family type IV/VI secretion system protein n=1 Tax=Achromobacter sp. MFA1 R4 TaxID=1881016 RepID=UPI00095398CD|nr:DotU family type IV/VI secretion system protein [Achromobacter sp. MFA1 R4]SIT13644.1 type VI secretion system protein ImpK [Achromobacter sp. MFA1 R4]
MTQAVRAGADPDLFLHTPMLDETLLHLAVLDRHARLGPLHAWRARCVALMAEVDGALLARNVTPEQAHRLRLSHALLLDDATLASCPEPMRKEWQDATLCRIELGEPDAADVVLAHLDALARHPDRGGAWLNWYARLFAAGLLRRRPDAIQRCRQVNERLREAWPWACGEEQGSD